MNEPCPALKSLDDEGRVIYIGSLSKTLFPGLRLGFMVAPKAVIAEARRVVGDGPTYITFDVDGLDPVYAPGTGTPEPGGLGWYETLALIRKIAEKKRIVGMDLVEFSKMDNSEAPAFLCSKLVYKTLAYIFEGETPKVRKG